jgi:hypothetical protein
VAEEPIEVEAAVEPVKEAEPEIEVGQTGTAIAEESARAHPVEVDELPISAELREQSTTAASPAEQVEPLEFEINSVAMEPPAIDQPAATPIDRPPSLSISSVESVETIDHTEPTVESALAMEPELDSAESSSPPDEIIDTGSAMTDTAFGRAVQDFTGSGLGPLVEEQAPAATIDVPEEFIANPLPPVDQDSEAIAEETSLSAETFGPLGGLNLTSEEISFDLPETASDELQSLTSTAELPLHTPPTIDATPSASDGELTAIEPSLEIPLDLHEADQSLDFSESATEAEMPLGLQKAEDRFEQPAIDELIAAQEPASFPQELATLEPAAPVAEAPNAPAPIEESGPTVTPIPAISPYFGMQRDMGSFIGGMPLALVPSVAAPAAVIGGAVVAPPIVAPKTPPAAAIPAAQPAAAAPVTPLDQEAPVTAPTPARDSATALAEEAPAPIAAEADHQATDDELSFPETASEVPDLDDALFEGEEPLELFDETAEQLDSLPDSLEPIADLNAALAVDDSGPKGSLTAAADVATPAEPAKSFTQQSSPAPAPEPAAPEPAPMLQSLTATAAAVAKPAVEAAAAGAPVVIPPFVGARAGARAGVNGFAGMAIPKIKSADVFSQTAFPPLDESIFRPQPVDIPPMTMRAPGAGASTTAKKQNPERKPPPWRVPGAAPGAAAPKGAGAQPPGGATGTPRPRKPWWKNIRHLLPLLLILIVAAAAIIIRFFPPRTLVQGAVRMQNREGNSANVLERKKQVNDLRTALQATDFRDIVVGNLKEQNIAPGFVVDPTAMHELASPENSPFDEKRQALLLTRASNDPKGDQARLQAVMSVMYSTNRTAAEKASKAQGDIKAAQDDLDAKQKQLKEMQDSVRSLSDQIKLSGSADAQGDPSAAVTTLQLAQAKLKAVLAQANADVNAKRTALADARAGASPSGKAADPALATMRQNLSSLNARLSILKAAESGQADPAGALNDAMDKLSPLLQSIVLSNHTGALQMYASHATQSLVEIRQLLDLNKQNAENVAELRRQLTEHREARLREVWAGDETLRLLLEERQALAHRYSAAAADSGHSDEAIKIRGAMDAQDQRIDARRQSLATGGQYADDLQKDLEQTIDRLEQDRHNVGRKIAVAIKLLEIPATETVPQADQGVLQRLGEQVAGANAAYDQYAAATSSASASDAQKQARQLESQIADQQAQLDAYQQQQDSPTALAARQSLDKAQDAEAKAQANYSNNLKLLSWARQSREAQSQEPMLIAQIEQGSANVQRIKDEANQVPVLLPPDPSAIAEIHEPDQRVWYLAGAIGALLLLFAWPIWSALRGPALEMPYAAIVAERYETPSSRHTKHDYSQVEDLDDSEHAAMA